MENKTNKILDTKRKVLSLICLIIFSLVFVFACLKNVLPLGRLIACTFGVMTYPLFLVLSLIELAGFLGLKYRRNKKSTVYFLLALISLLFVIQAISTYKQLDLVVSFSSLKTYLKFSYSAKITFVGSFGSIFVGIIAILLGAMGAIVAFVIMFTIMVGLIIDYENYGKFDDNIKKLSKRKIREKVNNSDKDAKNGMPNYAYTNSSDEFASIEVGEEDFAKNANFEKASQTPNYSGEDVVGEIEETYDENVSYQTYEPYTQNPFSSQTDDELMQKRREFMGNTFGVKREFVSNSEPVEVSTPNYVESVKREYEPVEIPKTNNLWGNDEKDGFQIDESIKDILTKEEDVVDNLSTDNEIDSQNGFAQNEIFNTKNNPYFGGLNTTNLQNPQIKTNPTSGFNQPNGQEFGQNTSPQAANQGLFNQKFNPEPQSGSGVEFGQKFGQNIEFGNDSGDIENRNNGILTGNTTPKKIEKQEKPVIPKGNQTTMIGVRYNPPPLSLLARPVKDTGNYTEEQNRKSRQLEDVLESFNVPAKVVNIVRGPKITRYELSVPYGVSVKKIPNYEQDIQRALAAKSVTIQAPIPGSSYVGIELENDSFTSVVERELLESPEYQNAKGPLPIAVGKDISGQIIVKSLAKMVHVLVAGSTGSGKSVFIHNIVLSLIFRYGPEDLRLVMIDPKQVEFKFYNGLPHLVTPEVVLGTEKAVGALKWCVKEMDRRFKIMGQANYQNIEEYNKSELVKSGQFEHFPYIVIIVDELAEIMINYKKEAEPLIQRITQLARACGMHLIIAVQRPSVNIITGVIKNNVPSRFAFRLQSSFDSKTMLDTVGAEKLLNQGDMLMQLTDTSAMPRLQGAYASNDEIRAVVDFVKRNNVAVFDEEAEKAINAGPQAPDDAGAGDKFVDSAPSNDRVDEYFKVAVKLVMLADSASVSYLQRRLSIGYSRASRIVDQMEEKGFIGPATGAKKRQVLITKDQYKEIFGEEFDS